MSAQIIVLLAVGLSLAHCFHDQAAIRNEEDYAADNLEMDHRSGPVLTEEELYNEWLNSAGSDDVRMSDTAMQNIHRQRSDVASSEDQRDYNAMTDELDDNFRASAMKNVNKAKPQSRRRGWVAKASAMKNVNIGWGRRRQYRPSNGNAAHVTARGDQRDYNAMTDELDDNFRASAKKNVNKSEFARRRRIVPSNANAAHVTARGDQRDYHAMTDDLELEDFNRAKPSPNRRRRLGRK